ncbi:MAG: YlmH/Sll1252 family protein [Cellulosilyticaceae bacterium]
MDWRKYATDEEKIFLQQLTAAQSKSQKQHRGISTSFFVKQWMEAVVCKYLGSGALDDIVFEGGYVDAERQVAVYNPNIYSDNEKNVSILKVTVQTGIGKSLTHRDFLGAVLGIGLEREKIGDIILTSFGAYIVCIPMLTEFIELNLNDIGRYGKVSICEIESSDMSIEQRQVKEVIGTVASLRADAVFSLAFGISRSQITKLLQQDKGKCNGIAVKSSESINVGAICTLRGYGKAKLTMINGITKKDRINIKIEKYI